MAGTNCIVLAAMFLFFEAGTAQVVKVTCSFTVDDNVDDVFYNGQRITDQVTPTGKLSDWTSAKSVSFQEVIGGVLLLRASEKDKTMKQDGNTGYITLGEGCKYQSGFQMKCTAPSGLWASVDTGSSYWKAIGIDKSGIDQSSPSWATIWSNWGKDAAARTKGLTSNWTDPCTSNSTFSLSGNEKVKKIWAANGGNPVLFAFFPPTPAPTPVPTPVPTPKIGLKSAGGWTIISGDCSINVTTNRPCVVSPHYPKNYGPEQFCNVSVSGGSVSLETFSTEKWFDTVRAGNIEYSGPMTGTVSNVSSLIWSSDFYTEGPGWMICEPIKGSPKV